MQQPIDDLVKAAYEVTSAIRHAGPHPDYHWRIMEQHRRQWPTLWRALDGLLAAVEGGAVLRNPGSALEESEQHPDDKGD